jgi:hypothetical protein
MKVFWSWQSDTHEKTCRYFVRDALDAAINQLKTPQDVEEPSEAARREQLHSDAGREGVPGSPDLARAIMQKIDTASVVIADVTPVGKGLPRKNADGIEIPAKALMNPNVAIELGYALGKHSTDETNNLLMILNTYYGDRQCLPFDLAHKAGPIEYKLAPNAPKEEVDNARNKLRGDFVIALRPFLEKRNPNTKEVSFQETPYTINEACFWQPSETIVSVVNPLSRITGQKEEWKAYKFAADCIFYLRLIPTTPLVTPLKHIELKDIVSRRPQILTGTINGGLPDRNSYGAISYGSDSYTDNLEGFTQLFQNGEIWGVTRIFAQPYREYIVIPSTNVENAYTRVLQNYIDIARNQFKLSTPYKIEIGAVGLKDKRIGYNPLSNALSDRIFKPTLKMRQILNDFSEDSQRKIIQTFIDALLDLGGVSKEH